MLQCKLYVFTVEIKIIIMKLKPYTHRVSLHFRFLKRQYHCILDFVTHHLRQQKYSEVGGKYSYGNGLYLFRIALKLKINMSAKLQVNLPCSAPLETV